ncbi:uncharacterized protein TRIVIDRAFT_69132 [Trichoderma virens Gv29-8]|uniref:Zn(2)-C6 fungal-type domain-containing protein n=1 Tax=Hypocrea virens (strain Gv29-8 / FGSC 10586) TaxID=413071 RepID=G9MYI7_HYPVG|nr:uncharacterized protein TRIVIDRAFT_69132 [Trichoderma virens Gv29-8]EHK20607.1 hypothetical protein TRIVIDRAFT_69132 [Trichoderma virens Gv29-8]UKZ53068.1 hypothetical protein TrVGV298_006855 [Trichoderma virens]
MPGGESTATENIPAGDFDLLLFRRRRFRTAKACYPCRRRKVKCDLNQPCGTCISREHPDLCDYTTNTFAGAESSTSEQSPSAREQPEAAHVNDAASEIAQGFTTFPFTNLWMPSDGIEKVYSALPEDDVILKLFRESLFHLEPSIVNVRNFETMLLEFLRKRRTVPSNTYPEPLSESTISWFGLLFGILSCGAQLAAVEGVEGALDTTKAWVFACCSFQCLRFCNFTSYPNIEVVQALIMLVNYLRNQGDAGASWSMLGLAIRLAQTLGIHCTPDPNSISNAKKREEAIIKSSIWRSLIWQDTLASLCYDRPSGITVLESIPSTTASPRFYSFFDSCHHLFVTANKIGHSLTQAKFSGQRLSNESILDFRKVVNIIETRSVPHLQDLSKCQSKNDYVQHYIFRLFTDSVMVCLYRPTMTGDETQDDDITDYYLNRCRSALQTYMELLSLNAPFQRLWFFVHITFSCALILGQAAYTRNVPSDKAFLKRFFNSLSQSRTFVSVPVYENAWRLLHEFLMGNDNSMEE